MQKADSANRSRAELTDPPKVGEAGVDLIFLRSVNCEDLIDLIGISLGRWSLGDETVS